MSITPLYQSLNSELKVQSVGVNASELHGFISGILAGGVTDNSWKVLLNDMVNDGQAFSGSLAKLINELYETTEQQFISDEFDFSLLIDEEELFTKIDDTVAWTNHFLLGLGLAQPQLSNIKGDVGEAIYDLRQIIQLGYDEDDDQEELAFAFEEILEYIRMTAILCHDEFSEVEKSTTVH